MYFPLTTYRIQFNKSFTFKDLKGIIPYLDKLGIKTIYASPIFDAMPGSVHGYDGTDPNNINPEIGTYEELKEIALQLKERGMGWIQDFVPNHMAYSIKNAWLCDFLEKGKMSLYNKYFDVAANEQIMAPFLETSLESAIDQNKIEIIYEEGQLRIRTAQTSFPLNYIAYSYFLHHELLNDFDKGNLITELDNVVRIKGKASFHKEWKVFLGNFQEHFSQANSRELLKKKSEQLSRDKAFIKQVLDAQFYRLCDWKETSHSINYRRFFTINSLICINIHHPGVFDNYHWLLAQLVKEGIFQGVRIDHIDGLYDPGKYLNDLRNLLGDDTYIVVEKILGQNEKIPSSWPVQGTTGYDFLAQVNNVLINEHGVKALKTFYDEAAGHKSEKSGLIEMYKEKFLRSHMQGELNNLFIQFRSIFENNIPEGITDDNIKELIAEILVYCPVYRFYIDELPFSDGNHAKINALMDAINSRGNVSLTALKFFKDYFIDDLECENEEKRNEILHFWRRSMQFSGPLMAKGIEDTLAYNYNAFLANNEVGNDIHSEGINTQRFHKLMEAKAKDYPLSLNATATHDTKRGEDSRSRLQYLTLSPRSWLENVQTLLNEPDNGTLVAEDKYFVLQIIYSSLEPEGDTEAYKARFKDFIVKAAREAGNISSWHKPDEAYEENLISYGLSVIDKHGGKCIHDFLKDKEEDIAIHALAQLVLKCTCLGIPDIYQGTELWDLSFVDPDNRRPVDYDLRMKMLSAFDVEGEKPEQSITAPSAKLHVLYKLLQLRKENEELFKNGSYKPLPVSPQFLSFVRSYKGKHLVVIVPLDRKPEIKTALDLPPDISGNFKNIFNGRSVAATEINIQEQLQEFPLLVMISQAATNNRKSGILLPLFSLPSDFGIGGLGKEAYDFITMLSKAGQKLWQLLPLNPVQKESHYSPYACISAFAGEPMYIDPVSLQQEGLLSEEDVQSVLSKSKKKVSYAAVEEAKTAMLKKAWSNFKKGSYTNLERAFIHFYNAEKEWLDDFALFLIIKEQNDDKPWIHWPKPLRNRDVGALEIISTTHEDALNFRKWVQFIFYRQWKNIKKAANVKGIKLVGDIPFYLSHNSSDVWANKALFSLDTEGRMLLSAGVPPDYFSKTGQLWLMPTYNWKVAKETGFEWWLKRIQQNARLFDVIRLDHFRAFYDYWEVPADHKDAIAGKWNDGPRDELFGLIQKHFPDMPFIAEDLGEIHTGVFDFKDRYGLKGMRILQFGFDPFDGKLRDLPHNFDKNTVVYTGTHDNDTVTGWFERLSKKSKAALTQYAGCKVNKNNVHDILIEMAHRSVGVWSIIPLQDILKLNESSRLNTPATTKHNWLWRLLAGEFTDKDIIKLKKWTEVFNR
jgi:malto-oligosyltrehalose synthase/4-alpha-glucanotransferase